MNLCSYTRIFVQLIFGNDHILKILGVTVTDKLSMSEHVRDVVLKCAQSLHVINMLRRHGMNDQALQAVYRSVVLAKLIYASSAW